MGFTGATGPDLNPDLPDPETATMEKLRARLAQEAEAAGLLDIAYRTVDTPVGPVLLAATEQGLLRVAFEVQDHESVLLQLAERVSPRVLRAPGRLEQASRQLDEYFAGRRHHFELSLDWRLARGFRLDTLHQLPHIAYGHTATYAEVAVAAGSPRAVRAVGTACATNPLPLVVPCHRVVRSDGSAGQYAGGADAKQLLLEMEAAS